MRSHIPISFGLHDGFCHRTEGCQKALYLADNDVCVRERWVVSRKKKWMRSQKISKSPSGEGDFGIYRLKYRSNSAGWGMAESWRHSSRLRVMKFLISSSGNTPPAVR